MRDLLRDPLRIGILGCGSFVERRILPILSEVPSIQVICLQNRSLLKAQRMARDFGIARAVNTKEELVEKSEIEAVFITSANFCHEEDALACAEAYKPVLCEKPLSISFSSTERMVEAFQAKNLPFLVGHQLRFKSSLQKIKQYYLEGKLGDLLHIRAFYYSRTLPENNWRLQKGNGGGALQEIGVHLIDLIHFITQEKIEPSHAAALPTLQDKAETMVSLQGHLKNSQALVSIECSFQRPYYNGIEVIGTKGRMVSEGSLRQTYDPGEILYFEGENGEKTYLPLKASNLYVDELKHFAEVVAFERSSILSAEISLSSQSTIDKGYELLEATSVNSSYLS